MDGASLWLGQARALLFDARGRDVSPTAIEDLRSYLVESDGRFFEQLYDVHAANRFTASDLLAVTSLGVVVPPPVVMLLLERTATATVASLLSTIDTDRCVEDLPPEDYEQLLGERSAAWSLWDFLNVQPGIGPTIAGKLMAAKRPRLIPISDFHVKDTLGATDRDFWKCVWTVLADNQLRAALGAIRDAVPDAWNLSLLRVLDIVAWSAGTALMRSSL